jgi:hypothetical protein
MARDAGASGACAIPRQRALDRRGAAFAWGFGAVRARGVPSASRRPQPGVGHSTSSRAQSSCATTPHAHVTRSAPTSPLPSLDRD